MVTDFYHRARRRVLLKRAVSQNFLTTMEVLNARAAMVSNFEVFALLQEKMQQESSKKRNRKQENLATISYEVMKYLEKTPCRLQSEETIRTVPCRCCAV